jgi:hypothetical protein
MAKKEKTPPKKPAISSYWLYASIILFFIGMSFFGRERQHVWATTKRLTFQTFERYLLRWRS